MFPVSVPCLVLSRRTRLRAPISGSVLAILLLAACPALPAQATIRRHLSPFPDDNFGASVVALGDVTGDGVPDYGAGTLAVPWQPARFDVFSGATGALVRSIASPMVSGGGDLDGDGLNDVAILPLSLGVPLRIESVVSGALLANIPIPPGQNLSKWSMLADLNGDGRAEVIAAAVTYAGGPVFVFNNNTSLRATLMASSFGNFGDRGAVVSDFDGDGWKDIAVSGAAAGLHVFSSTTGAVLRTYPGSSTTFAVVGDLDGDSMTDIVRRISPITAISGQTGATIWTSPWEPGLDAFGDFAAAGDIDGDGLEDLAGPMGGPGHFPFPGNPMLGVISGADGTVPLAFRGGSTGFATGFAAIGDIDGDGVSELAQGEISYTVAGGTSDEMTILSTRAAPSGIRDTFILGAGCAQAPFLGFDRPPVFGSVVELLMDNGPPNASGILVIHDDRPAPTPILGGCLIVPDVTQFAEWLIFPLATGAFGEVAAAFAVPNQPALTNLSLTLQAGFTTAAGIVVSTGAVLVFGS